MLPDCAATGAGTERAEKIMREPYAPFLNGTANRFPIDSLSARITKYADNCTPATNGAHCQNGASPGKCRRK